VTLPLRRNAPRFTATRLARSGPAPSGRIDFYGPALVGAETIGARALDPAVFDRVIGTLLATDPDEYVTYVDGFVSSGRRRAGGDWRYADITTVLAAAAELLEPASYLEIGVRRGRSMSVVASRAPSCAVIGIDVWNEGYAGIENPGPEHVRGIVADSGHTGTLELLSGDSHQLLPQLFRDRPELDFDLITVDGDHSRRGAARDLVDVLPRLRIGGALVFDDMSHPAHPYLHKVWRQRVASNRRFATWSFDDVGYGVAVAVRRW
jgi:predicted O-methyltransferase YrrM